MTTDITTAISTIVTALERERDGFVTQLKGAETRLLAARSLLTPNGPASTEKVPAAGIASRDGARHPGARRAMQRGGKWIWERVRDSLDERGGPMTFVALERRLKSRNLRREVSRHPLVFEACTVPKSGRGFRFKTAQAVRLVGARK